MDWNHVTAPVSGEILRSDHPPTVIQILRAMREMTEALEEDRLNGEVGHRAFAARERALDDLMGVASEDNDCFDENGEPTGNAGIDKLAAVSAIRRFWSDGEVS